jgi:hypothetical protein
VTCSRIGSMFVDMTTITGGRSTPDDGGSVFEK